MKTVAEWGEFYISSKDGVYSLFRTGNRKALYRHEDYWRVENQLVSLAW